jgi:hypothetical protein
MVMPSWASSPWMRIAPGWVLPSEPDDQSSCFGDGGGSAGPVRVGPVLRDEPSMPPYDRVGLHQEERPAFTCERGEDGAVVGRERWVRVLALQHGELVAQYEDLDILGAIAPTSQHQQIDHQANKTVETRHELIVPASEPRRSPPTRNACSACPHGYSAPTGPYGVRSRAFGLC